MLDDVVAGLLAGSLAGAADDGLQGLWARRKAKALLGGKTVRIPAYLQCRQGKPRLGRVVLRPDAATMMWRPWPRLGRGVVELQGPNGRAPVTRTHMVEVPAWLRGPAWMVSTDEGDDAVLFFATPMSRVFGPVFDGGQAPPAPPVERPP